MTPKEIRELTGLSQAAFCSKYEIPLKTFQKWEQGTNICPKYVLKLLERTVKDDILKEIIDKVINKTEDIQ